MKERKYGRRELRIDGREVGKRGYEEGHKERNERGRKGKE